MTSNEQSAVLYVSRIYAVEDNTRVSQNTANDHSVVQVRAGHPYQPANYFGHAVTK